MVPGLRWRSTVRRRWSSHALDLVGQHLRPFPVGDVGRVLAERDPIDVDELADAIRVRVSEMERDRAALGMADDGERGPVAHIIEDGDRIAHVGFPAVQGGVLAVSVSALVPAHGAPPGIGEQWREDVVRAGEIEPAVSEDDRRVVGVAPFVRRDQHAAGIDRPFPIGGSSAGVGHRRVGHGDAL